MPDREKVINAIKCRAERHKRCGNPCEETGFCHYATAVRGLDGCIYKPYVCDVERLCNDVLDLLKEQEAEWLEVDDKHDAFDCSNCGAMAGRKCLYCPGCGAKMKNGTRAMEGR